MEVTTALIPSELLARYDALPYDGTYKKADDTLSTVFAEALAAVVNAIEGNVWWERDWEHHEAYHHEESVGCCFCGGPCNHTDLPTRFILKEESTP